MTPGLASLNNASVNAATQMLLRCCASPDWAQALTKLRPFVDLAQLQTQAAAVWAAVDDEQRLLAFAAHPLIGDVELLRARYDDAQDQANAEQGQVLAASDQVLQDLATINLAYRERHGFIFIVCASGKSADEMLALVQQRINNSREQEMLNAANEQQKITELRLAQLANERRSQP